MTRSPIAGRTSTATAAPDCDEVDQPAEEGAAAREGDCRSRIARLDPVVPPVFRQTEERPIGEPCQLFGQLGALGGRQFHADCEAAGKRAGDGSLEPAEVVEVGDNAFVQFDADVRLEGDASRRQVDRGAIEFLPGGAHEPPANAEFHPLLTAAVSGRQLDDCSRQNAHSSDLLVAGHARYGNDAIRECRKPIGRQLTPCYTGRLREA